MNITPQSLFTAARATLSDPAGAARQVMALRLTTGEGLMAIATIAVVDALLILLIILIMKIAGPLPDASFQEMLDQPFLLAASQFFPLIFVAFLMWLLGKAFGGTGTFANSLALTAWLEVVMMFLKMGLMLLLLVVPVLAMPLLLAYFYLLSQFTATLNGFSSPLKTFAGILLILFAISFCLGMVIAILVPVQHV